MTEPEFCDTVLENLGVLAAGQTASAEDVAIIKRRMTAVFAQLEQEDIASVPDTENIDDGQAMPLADVVTLACTAPFGISGQKLMELAAADAAGRAALKVINRERPSSTVLSQQRWWGGRGRYNGHY